MGCTIRLDADKPVTIKAGESKSIDNYKLELLAESPEPVKAVAKKSAGGYRLPPKVVAVTMLSFVCIYCPEQVEGKTKTHSAGA
jgi:hypothetical protein